MQFRLRGNFSTDPNECIEEILKNRGVEDIDAFLSPGIECELDYNNLDNINDGVEMLIKHIKNGSHIGLVVDSDVDGITSSSIMYLYIKDIDPDANIHYFVHEGKKHGIEDITKEIEDSDETYNLLIVPDAGSNDIEFMNRLGELGIEILVIDHHDCEYEGYDCVPSNTIVINNQQSKNYKNKQLCGAGMVYKFCEALDAKLDLHNAFKYIDIAALGEVADSCLKTDTETNYIMNSGLKHIQNEAIKSILAAQKSKLGDKSDFPYYGLTTNDLGFYVAPLLNAIVRVGSVKDNEKVVEAFINSNTGIAELVADIGADCRDKQNVLKEKIIDYVDMKIMGDCLDENNIIIVPLEPDEIDFPNTLTGLIAANEVGKYGKPVLIGRIGPDGKTLKGSIRGNENFAEVPDLKNYLMSSGYFESVLGHPNSAGFAIPVKNIDAFNDYANKNLSAKAFDNCYAVDYIFDADDYNLFSLAYKIASRPDIFGNGIDEVSFLIKNVPTDCMTIMGANKTSCKINRNGIDYVRFKDLDFIDTAQSSEKIDVICKFSLNFFRGKCSLQATIDAYEPSKKNKYEF